MQYAPTHKQIMTNIKIEELNFIKTKGLWWVIAFGWIPVVNFFLAFLFSLWKKYNLNKKKIDLVPFLFASGSKQNASPWGIFYAVLAIVLALALLLFTDFLNDFNIWMLSILIFWIFPMFTIGVLLFLYCSRYQQYIVFVNNFLNNVMLKNQQNGRFDSAVFLNNPYGVHSDTVSMIKDLAENNVLSIEDDMIRNRNIIVFTREFQQVLEKTIKFY